jgi:predicted branched-subunit amino acid permease
VPAPTPPERTFADGARDGLPYAGAALLLSLSFGWSPPTSGLTAVAAVVMSAVVFAGSAQFAAIGILGAGGGIGAAVAAATLMNSRFLPMGLALGPSLRGSRARRASRARRWSTRRG